MKCVQIFVILRPKIVVELLLEAFGGSDGLQEAPMKPSPGTGDKGLSSSASTLPEANGLGGIVQRFAAAQSITIAKQCSHNLGRSQTADGT